MIVTVEVLYNKLYNIYVKELLNVNIGYSFNKSSLCVMNEIINAIYYIKQGNPTNDEIIKLIQYYGEI